MKKWLRRVLGIKVLIYNIDNLEDSVNGLIDDIATLNANVGKLSTLIRVNESALGRIIAKLEPALTKDELDPARKAESDRLGEETIKRLIAEDWALLYTTGEIE
jgi:hypothetical protein